MQCFNVFAVKARFRVRSISVPPPYRHVPHFPPQFPFGRQAVGNKWNFAGILAGAALGMFIIYTPPLHVVFGGSKNTSPLYWLISFAFGLLLLAWASIRVLFMRRGIEQAKVKDIKGLMMCTLFPFLVWCCLLI